MSDVDHRVYSGDKLRAHPDVLEHFRTRGVGLLRTLHVFPTNICNQSCAFCAYRLDGNSNSTEFDPRVEIPWSDMQSLIRDAEELGVQGIEISGGGEPLAYRWTDLLWGRLSVSSMATALVTNGVLLKGKAELICGSGLRWVRVSIDSARRETYARMRQTSEEQFDRAWHAVRQFRTYAPRDPDFRLGVGFVASNENLDEVYDFVRMAREHGADNVRISAVISDLNIGYYTDRKKLERACGEESARAKDDFESSVFKVYNFLPRRVWEALHPVQDYRRCPTKDVLCLVEGSGKVYTCCTFAGSLSGLYGNFREHPGGFKALWLENEAWRRKFDASKYCQNACLYRDRNIEANALIDGEMEEQPIDTHPVIHKEFL